MYDLQRPETPTSMFRLKLLVTAVCEQVFLMSMETWKCWRKTKLNCHVTRHHLILPTSAGTIHIMLTMGRRFYTISMLTVRSVMICKNVLAFTTPLWAITVCKYWTFILMMPEYIAVLTGNNYWRDTLFMSTLTVSIHSFETYLMSKLLHNYIVAP